MPVSGAPVFGVPAPGVSGVPVFGVPEPGVFGLPVSGFGSGFDSGLTGLSDGGVVLPDSGGVVPVFPGCTGVGFTAQFHVPSLPSRPSLPSLPFFTTISCFVPSGFVMTIV